MTTAGILLPGDTIPASILPVRAPSSSGHAGPALKLGPGLQYSTSNSQDLTATLTGPLRIDQKKHTVWIDNTNPRYLPRVGDQVIATVHHLAAETFHCVLVPHASSLALLPQLAFANVNKKSRPQLKSGALVYARVLAAPGYSVGAGAASCVTEVEITCVNPTTGKSDGMGELKGGMLFDVSLRMAEALLRGKSKQDEMVVVMVVLHALAEKIAFEVAVGRNGKVWVKTQGEVDQEKSKDSEAAQGGNWIRETMVVGRALQETDQKRLSVEQQKKLVRKLLKQVA